jgi:hypothetical protein
MHNLVIEMILNVKGCKELKKNRERTDAGWPTTRGEEKRGGELMIA